MKREKKEEILSRIRKDAGEIFRVILEEGGSEKTDQMILNLVRETREITEPIRSHDLCGGGTDYAGSFLMGLLLGWSTRKKYQEY